MTTCPQLSEDMAPGFEFDSPPKLVRKSYSFQQHKSLVTVVFCVFLANRLSQTMMRYDLANFFDVEKDMVMF